MASKAVGITLAIIALVAVPYARGDEPAKSAPKSAPAIAATTAIAVNINTATAEQLAYLPSVGGKLAGRIVEYRTEHGPFVRVADLRLVKGFGGDGKRLGHVSPYAMVSGPTTAGRKIKGGVR